MTARPSVVPRPLRGSDEGLVGPSDDRLRLYVWQVPVRISHWVTAGCIVVLSVTGLYIGDPFLLPPGGRLMGDLRLIHLIAAFTLLVSGMVRVVYLIAGNRFARWWAFVPTSRKQATELFRQAAFYGFITNHHPKVLGHNQLAAAAYLALWALLLVETITGFALDGLVGNEPGATAFWWLRELFGPQFLRLIHHLCMWAILAIAVFHVYSCILIDHIERNGLVSSIVSGYKYVVPEEILESRDGGPELLAAREDGVDVATTTTSDEPGEAAGADEAPDAEAVRDRAPSPPSPVDAAEPTITADGVDPGARP
jgi:Ni/Fe-hydrogenase 1 B-type cytochrome subunit